MADTILSALNKLVEKNGGDTEDNKLIVDAINDLVESGGGSSAIPVIEATYEEETNKYKITKAPQSLVDGLVILNLEGSAYIILASHQANDSWVFVDNGLLQAAISSGELLANYVAFSTNELVVGGYIEETQSGTYSIAATFD